ncbi:MAG TPA: sialidase family protein [Candidatus Limnocylindrales bacterium]|nr:sialidase family protein [Candidatus Limnocylindrales bacterium]
MRRIRSTFASALVGATLLSLSLSGIAIGADWGEPVTIWSSSAETYNKFHSWPVGLVTAGGSALVASYGETVAETGATDIYVVRSADGGLTWQPRVRVSRPGSATRDSWARSISSYGTAVDVAWLEDSANRGIRYSRSLDGGVTFSPSISLSGGSGSYPDVARGPNGLVVVAWNAFNKGKLFIRVSHDGGATFDSKRALWSGHYDHNPSFSVAVGDGIVYAGVGLPGEGVLVRKSIGGSSWSASTQLAYAGSGALGFQLVAEGQRVYLGYTKPTATGSAPWVRRSINGGATWSAGVKIAPGNDALAWPRMNLSGGVVRVTYGRTVTTTNPATTEVFYQQSSDGTTWSTPTSVSTTPANYSIPIGVAHGDHTVVAYKHWAPVHYSGDIQVRVGTD